MTKNFMMCMKKQKEMTQAKIFNLIRLHKATQLRNKLPRTKTMKNMWTMTKYSLCLKWRKIQDLAITKFLN